MKIFLERQMFGMEVKTQSNFGGTHPQALSLKAKHGHL